MISQPEKRKPDSADVLNKFKTDYFYLLNAFYEADPNVLFSEKYLYYKGIYFYVKNKIAYLVSSYSINSYRLVDLEKKY